jgi:hypothetical protein
MLDMCSQCTRVHSTVARDSTPASPNRCPECRLPLPMPAERRGAAREAEGAVTGWRPRDFAALLVVSAVVGLGVCQVWFPGRSFDRELWRDESLVADGVRHDMAVRMLARDTLLGKTRAEVVELLGDAAERDLFRPEPDLLVYRLGPNRHPFPIPAMDSEWLSVILGPDGRVVRCKLWED